MDRRRITFKIIYLLVMLGSVAAIFCSVFNASLSRIDWQLAVLALITIFFSSKLHFQLPKTKIHFSVGDVLILFSIWKYGIAVSMILALLESLYTSYSFKRKGINIKNRTFALNVATHTLSVFITAVVTYYLFSPIDDVFNDPGYNSVIPLMLTLWLTQFFSNTILVAIFAAEKSGRTVWAVWTEDCLNLGLLYLLESILAVSTYKLIIQTNLLLICLTFGLAAVVYLTYRRYISEIKQIAALAELAERDRTESEKLRAEQAERHVSELTGLLEEQERIGKQLLESKNQFRHAAFHDNLTDLPNRNSAVDHLSALHGISRADPNYKFAVLYVDINSFKHINDSLGYAFGDLMLKKVAQRLGSILDDGGVVARFSSDEFAVVINKNVTEGNAAALAEIIHGKISEPFNLQNRQIFTSPCIGIVMSGAHYENVEDMLRDAEIAMYQAKRRQQPFVLFDRSMHDSVIERIELEADLRTAIERREFCLYYQPIVDLETVRIAGFEALVRWNHPQKGIVPPFRFIPVAEDTGLIIPMTEWILREACRQVRMWQQFYDHDLTVSVNISGKHFAQNDLIGLVETVLRETDFAPSKLKLEITEGAVMEDAEKAIFILKALKTVGVKLMIDDFGTGYSSLNYLHKFPIDTLKVDRSFVNTMDNQDEQNEIVNTIILMAKNLRLDVVAEGIETVSQFRLLRNLNCEKGQGYLFSKPKTPEQIEILLSDPDPWREIVQPSEMDRRLPLIETDAGSSFEIN